MRRLTTYGQILDALGEIHIYVPDHEIKLILTLESTKAQWCIVEFVKLREKR